MQVIKNGTGLDPEEAPKKPDDTSYNFEMITEGGSNRVYADTPEELLNYLIPGYTALPDEVARTAKRLVYAVTVQVAIQSEIMSEVEESYAIVPSPEELDVLLAPRDVPPVLETWVSEIQLVLVESYYHPQGDLPRPIGLELGGGESGANIIWLDPSGELPFVVSLARAGWIKLNLKNN